MKPSEQHTANDNNTMHERYKQLKLALRKWVKRNKGFALDVQTFGVSIVRVSDGMLMGTIGEYAAPIGIQRIYGELMELEVELFMGSTPTIEIEYK